ncbi:Tol-Pal system beta propeller repeat protein TolB [Rodentibacter sp. Ppn85]|uniref:Tol-Pal system beta propeller repeat protein TolB n=1 Tax=Rodentibacter sp. Ppn85 TaxID=1908525 RepID=UPI0009856292|nr:Tol-Pal system beta propeller repeat protein TolB [Rodentibacter sp. Ppn85]OOF65952.1 Tol-Pal system beta propeller repeat protein TolB [Rodentibacter sp. Ppn85]
MKLIKKLVGVFAIVLAIVGNAVAEDEVRIVIDEGVDGARPIAVVPFAGAAPEDIGKIVADDLRNSGKFNPIPVAQMPQKPISASEVNPEAWSALGVDAVVVGQVTATGSGYNISYQLVDTVGASGTAGTVLTQNSYTVTNKWLRYGAHTVSDEVFEKLTGIRGAFRTRIAYVVQKNGGSQPYEVRVADYDGYNQFVVNRSSQPIMSPAWSPDGKRLAYVSFENRKSQLVVQDLGSGARKVVASFSGHNGAPAFSPDGSRLAFASSQDGTLNIYVMSSNGGTPTQLTRGSGNNTEPSWSPDGSSILFTSDRGGSPQVYRMNANGGGVTLVGGRGSAQISSDGKTLVMINGNNNVVKQDLASGASEVLSTSFLGESPSISPNGIMIIYSSTQGLGKVLQLVSADGRFKASLPGSNGQVKFPAWSPYLTK